MDLSGGQAPSVVSLLPGELIGNEQVFRVLFKVGTNEFVFILPPGLRVEPTNEGAISMAPQDMTYYLSVRILGQVMLESGLKAALRECLSNDYPQATSFEEFTTVTAEHQGPGIQFEVVLPRIGDRLLRVVRMPLKAGLVEFTLNASRSNASDAIRALESILSTLRSNDRGTLEIIKRSEQT
jgi:hypothetical protein